MNLPADAFPGGWYSQVVSITAVSFPMRGTNKYLAIHHRSTLPFSLRTLAQFGGSLFARSSSEITTSSAAGFRSPWSLRTFTQSVGRVFKRSAWDVEVPSRVPDRILAEAGGSKRAAFDALCDAFSAGFLAGSWLSYPLLRFSCAGEIFDWTSAAFAT